MPYIFSTKPEKNLGFSSKFRQGRVTLNKGIFLFGLTNVWKNAHNVPLYLLIMIITANVILFQQTWI